MSCKRFIAPIRDHAVGAPLDAIAAAHLEGCVSCRSALEEQRIIINGAADDLRRLLSVTSSSGFAARTSAALIHQPHSARSPLLQPAAWAALTAAAVAIAAAGASFIGRTGAAPGDGSGAAQVTVAGGPVSGSSPGGVAPGRRAPVGPDANESGPPLAAPPAPSRAYSRPQMRPRGPSLDPARQIEAPLVLVPADQARAIDRLQKLTATGVLHAEALPGAAPFDAAVPELIIAPLIVPEIPIPEIQTASGPRRDAVYTP